MVFEKTFNFQNHTIFYRVKGEGPAVMLLHGIPASGSLWQKQWMAIKGYKFIVPDLPGSGSSQLLPGTSMEGMAEVIRAVLDREGVVSAVLIGHSLGGYISMAFAERYSHYLLGLGLFHSTAFADSEERKLTRKKAIETIRNSGAPEFLATSTPNLFSPAHRDTNGDAIEDLIEQTKTFSSQTLIAYYEAMLQRPDRTVILKKLNIPVLFIAGVDDTAVPLPDILKQCHLPEISQIHILTDSGHMGMIEEEDKANAILAAYLDFATTCAHQ